MSGDTDCHGGILDVAFVFLAMFFLVASQECVYVAVVVVFRSETGRIERDQERRYTTAIDIRAIGCIPQTLIICNFQDAISQIRREFVYFKEKCWWEKWASYASREETLPRSADSSSKLQQCVATFDNRLMAHMSNHECGQR
ncbi:hypothetical protein R6Q59_033383 [Mikania micrantha]